MDFWPRVASQFPRQQTQRCVCKSALRISSLRSGRSGTGEGQVELCLTDTGGLSCSGTSGAGMTCQTCPEPKLGAQPWYPQNRQSLGQACWEGTVSDYRRGSFYPRVQPKGELRWHLVATPKNSKGWILYSRRGQPPRLSHTMPPPPPSTTEMETRRDTHSFNTFILQSQAHMLLPLQIDFFKKDFFINLKELERDIYYLLDHFPTCHIG